MLTHTSIYMFIFVYKKIDIIYKVDARHLTQHVKGFWR